MVRISFENKKIILTHASPKLQTLRTYSRQNVATESTDILHGKKKKKMSN